MNSEHKDHRERLREKYLKGGLDILADHEVLELLLFYAIPRRNTNDIAHRLEEKYGTNLAKIFELSIDELMSVEGIGLNSAILLHLIPQVIRRYQLAKRDDKESLATTDDLGHYALDFYMGKTEEEFSILALDSNRKVTDFTVICHGTVNETNIQLRKVIEHAIRIKATNIVLFHNHPNGSPLPSSNDKKVTCNIIKFLQGIGITVIDHIIVSSSGQYYSMKDMGNI